MVHRTDHVQRLCVRMIVYLCQIQDWRVRHTMIVKKFAPLSDRPACQHRFQQPSELLTVGYSARVGTEAVVVGQVRPANRLTQPLKESVIASRDDEMAIVRPKRLIRSKI